MLSVQGLPPAVRVGQNMLSLYAVAFGGNGGRPEAFRRDITPRRVCVHQLLSSTPYCTTTLLWGHVSVGVPKSTALVAPTVLFPLHRPFLRDYFTSSKILALSSLSIPDSGTSIILAGLRSGRTITFSSAAVEVHPTINEGGDRRGLGIDIESDTVRMRASRLLNVTTMSTPFTRYAHQSHPPSVHSQKPVRCWDAPVMLTARASLKGIASGGWRFVAWCGSRTFNATRRPVGSWIASVDYAHTAFAERTNNAIRGRFPSRLHRNGSPVVMK